MIHTLKAGPRIAAMAGALAFALAAPAQAEPGGLGPGQPDGPCNPKNAFASQGTCQTCEQRLYDRNLPPPTPYEAMKIPWDCGLPGAHNPEGLNLQGDPSYHQS